MTITHDMHGLAEEMRVCKDNAEVYEAGTIIRCDDQAGTCWVRWDAGHDSFDVEVDTLVPIRGNR